MLTLYAAYVASFVCYFKQNNYLVLDVSINQMFSDNYLYKCIAVLLYKTGLLS